MPKDNQNMFGITGLDPGVQALPLSASNIASPTSLCRTSFVIGLKIND
jgi:hypothetical protein